MNRPVSIVLLFGSDISTGQVSGVPGEKSRLQSIIDAGEEVEISVVSLGMPGSIPHLSQHVDLSQDGHSPLDRCLRAIGIFRLRSRLGTFPLGRLLNTMGPVDQGRVFWRSVRRNAAAIDLIRRADIAIAADMPAVKTAWISLRRQWVDSAYYDHRSASIGLTLASPGRQ